MTDTTTDPEAGTSKDAATLLGAIAAAADKGDDAPAPDSEADDAPVPDANDAVPAYEAFTLPDGVAVDPAALEAVHALFGEARLSQAQAQKFVDFALGRELEAQHRHLQAFQDLQERWVEQVKGDRAIGGQRLTASLALASRAIDRLGGKELRQALDLTGAGNHPAVVRAFVQLGRLLAEDRFAPGNPPRPAGPRSPAERIYGTAPLNGKRRV